MKGGEGRNRASHEGEARDGVGRVCGVVDVVKEGRCGADILQFTLDLCGFL